MQFDDRSVSRVETSASGRYQSLPVGANDDDADLGTDAVHLQLRRAARWTCFARTLFGLGLVVLAASITIIVLAPGWIHDFVLDYVSIVNPSSPLFRAWSNPQDVGVATFRKYYFYHIANPYDVVNGTAPHIVEMGPFVYRETMQKYDVRWYLNGTVGYKYQRLMTFVPEMSIDARSKRQLLDNETKFTIPNPALKGLLYRVGKLPGEGLGLNKLACIIIQLFLDGAVGKRGYFVETTAAAVLWGYLDPIWVDVHPLISLFGYTASTLFQAQWNGSAVVPSPYTYFTGQQCPLWNNQSACNGSAVGETIEVSGRRKGLATPQSELMVPPPGSWIPLSPGGVWPPEWQAPLPVPQPAAPIDTTSHGSITTWAGQQSLWWWGPMIDSITGGIEHSFGNATSPANVTPELPPPGVSGPAECRVVGGTDGMRFPPFLPESGATAELFVDMAGRSFGLEQIGTMNYDSIPALRLALAAEPFSNSSRNRYCYSQRFKGFVNESRPAFGPGLASQAFYQGTCLFDPEAKVPGDPNGARRCYDTEWKTPNGPWDDVDDGFTGKKLTLNLTFGLATPADPMAQAAPKLTFDQYIEAITGSPPFEGNAATAFQSFVDVHAMTGVTLKGRADAFMSLALGPYEVDQCGTAVNMTVPYLDWFTLKWKNVTVHYFNNTEKMVSTIVPFFRFEREAEATGYWVNKLKTDLRLLEAAKILIWVALAFGIVLVIGSVVVWFRVVPRIALGDESQYDRDPDLERLATGMAGGRRA